MNICLKQQHSFWPPWSLIWVQSTWVNVTCVTEYKIACQYIRCQSSVSAPELIYFPIGYIPFGSFILSLTCPFPLLFSSSLFPFSFFFKEAPKHASSLHVALQRKALFGHPCPLEPCGFSHLGGCVFMLIALDEWHTHTQTHTARHRLYFWPPKTVCDLMENFRTSSGDEGDEVLRSTQPPLCASLLMGLCS